MGLNLFMRMKHFNLYQYFEVILISGIRLAKPDPAIFQTSLELLNHDRKESVLMIGDVFHLILQVQILWH